MQRYIPQRRISQRLILSCVCPIAVSDSTLFFIYTCSYLHLLARKYTSHHITTHHICITLQKDCSLGSFFGFPLLPVFLATCNALDVPSLILRGVSTVFWHLVSRFARYLRYFGTWTLDFAFWNFNLSFGAIFAAFHPQNNANNCGLLVVLAILCCCGCGYPACFLWFLLFLLLLRFLLFLLVCGCGCGSGCSCGW